MKEIKDALDALDTFIGMSSDKDIKEINGKYPNLNVDCSDLDFWTDCLKVNMVYE